MALTLSVTMAVPARKALEAKGAVVTWDASNEANPVVVATKGANEIRIPVNTNIAFVNGVSTTPEGVVVYDGIGTTYLPQSAVDLLK